MAGPARHVAIVGGGIAGLATASALHEQAKAAGLPLACTLIEAEPRWGGKILTRRVGEFLIEAGPDSFLSQKPWALELCAKLSLSDRLINSNDHQKKTFVFSRGRLRELPEGLVVIVPTKLGPFLRGGLLSWPGIARMSLDLLLPARRQAADESLASFFTRRLGHEAFERVVEPLMAGIYAGDARQISIHATFPRFVEMEQRHGSLIRGVLAGRRAPRMSGRSLFVTLQDGLGVLVESLVDRLRFAGMTLMGGRKVAAIRVRSGKPGLWTYDLLTEDGPAITADAVVLATPAYGAAELVRPLSPHAAGLLETITYVSTATVSLAYGVHEVPPTLSGFGFVVPRVEGRDLLAATWTSLKWPQRAPASHLLIRCYVGGAGREQLLEADDETLIRRVRDELSSMTGLTANPTAVELHRWERSMPQYTLGHLQRLEEIRTALGRYPGLWLTGAGYRGVGIPDCIRDGGETASEVIRYVKRVVS